MREIRSAHLRYWIVLSSAPVDGRFHTPGPFYTDLSFSGLKIWVKRHSRNVGGNNLYIMEPELRLLARAVKAFFSSGLYGTVTEECLRSFVT